MLLLVDVGNTNTVMGTWNGSVMVHRWRISTAPERTSDEYRLLLSGLLAADEVEPEGAALSSVVPQVTTALRPVLEAMAGRLIIVGPGVKTGMAINIDNPREVGADRIANAIGAMDRFGAPVVIVDFGTATTVDLVGEDGSYQGGAIAPGLQVAADALVEATAALRRVELTEPKSPVGRSTVEATQSGLVYGFAGLVDGLVERVQATLPNPAPVVATGGLADLLAPLCRQEMTVDDDLTLCGLRIVYDLNQ